MVVLEPVKFPEITADHYYIPKLFDNPDERYTNLLNEIPYAQEKSVVYGKEFLQPRLTCILGINGEKKIYIFRI